MKFPYNNFSFKGLPFSWLLGYIASSCVGIEKVVAIFYNHETGRLDGEFIDIEGFDTLQGEVDPQPLIFADVREEIDKLRNARPSYEWLDMNELPFEITSEKGKTKIDPNVFNEKNKVILMLRFRNQFDKKSDLIFLYYRKKPKSWGPRSEDSVLTTDTKAMMAPTLFNLLKSRLLEMEADAKRFNLVGENAKYLTEKIELHREEIKQLKLKYGNSLINLCKSYLAGFERENKIRVMMDSKAEQLISGFTGDLNILSVSIEKAAIFAMSFMPAGSNQIVITDYHINLDVEKEIPLDEERTTVAEDRMNKVIHFLNNLEEGAKKVLRQNNPLTGLNVGLALKDAVTPPAITDAIKKHRPLIIKAMKNNPDNWTLIRNKFKPITNALITNNKLVTDEEII